MKSLIDEYVEKHGRSGSFYREALQVFPGGVTHDTRRAHPFPIFATHGTGARKWDVDGNEYLCYVMGHGALILGHSHPRIVEAVSTQVRKGTHLGCSTELEIRWAARVKRLMPAIEKLSFHSSGTEATMMAIRLARAYTGKTRIIKFSDHFHGWHDCVITDSGKYTSAGVPAAATDTVIRMEAGNIKKVQDVLREDTDVAAVILEPTGASMGCLPLEPGFLVQLREVTDKRGVVLIFDEVVTGFRVEPGGAQERFHVHPDLTALAKILGGGLPAGAVGGRSEIIDLLSFRNDPVWDRTERVSHPGTFNANPLSAASGICCLEMIAGGEINRKADDAACALRKGLNTILRRNKIRGLAYGLASVVWVVFDLDCDQDENVYALPHDVIRESLTSEKALKLKQALLTEGVDIMGTAEFIVSSAHGEREIDDTLHAFERALHRMKSEGLL